MDWKDLLADILFKKEATAGASGPKGSRQGTERFLGEIALPALQEVRAELEKHGQKVRLERDTAYLALTVLDAHGHEDFSYTLRIRTTRPPSFAFPEFEPGDNAKTVSRVEVMLRSGPASYDVSGYSGEQLIRHFLHEYRKWVGWRNAGESPKR
jgi:choline/glycine/proline betaine transport protein